MINNNNSDFPVPEIEEVELLLIDKMYAIRELYWPHYTWLAQTNYLKIVEKKQEKLFKQGIDPKLLREKLSSLFSKINSSFYHLQRIKENEELITELGKQVAKKGQTKISTRIIGTFLATYEPIAYEYEAILVTLKTALDILAIIFSSIIRSGSDDILKLAHEMSEVQKTSGFKTKLKKFFSDKKLQEVIKEFKKNGHVKSRRNYAVHDGDLSIGTINLQFVAGSSDIRVIKSKAMPVGKSDKPLTQVQDLDVFCTTLFYDVCHIILSGLELVLDENLPRGEKKSIFEIKRLKETS